MAPATGLSGRPGISSTDLLGPSPVDTAAWQDHADPAPTSRLASSTGDGAFLSQRARVHLVYRLAGRAIQAVMSGEPTTGARRSTPPWAVTDLGGARP